MYIDEHICTMVIDTVFIEYFFQQIVDISIRINGASIPVEKHLYLYEK
jgi:hypothetical protein